MSMTKPLLQALSVLVLSALLPVHGDQEVLHSPHLMRPTLPDTRVAILPEDDVGILLSVEVLYPILHSVLAVALLCHVII